MAETPGQRLYLIRLACGDGVRKAESLEDFSERVLTATGERYDPATLSRLERGLQGWRLEDSRVLASVDPLGRGEIWLSYGLETARAAEAVPEERVFYQAPIDKFKKVPKPTARRKRKR